MSRLALIRLATCALFVAACLLVRSRREPFAVYLLNYEDSDGLRLHESAARAAALIPKNPDFRVTRMSGGEVLAAALAATKMADTELKRYGEPQISLSREEGHLLWTVGLYLKGAPPGSSFEVAVDDE